MAAVSYTQTPYLIPTPYRSVWVVKKRFYHLPTIRRAAKTDKISKHCKHGLSVGLLELGSSHLALTAPLGSLSTSLGVKDKVPPPEAASVVANELLVVNIVVLSASPERQEVVQTPWELVAAVRVDSLEHTEDNPDIHGQNVEVSGDGAEDDWGSDSTEAQNHDLNGRGVLSGQAEGSGVLVVDLVDVLVEEGAGVHGTVGPVVPCVLEDEEDGDLVCHLVDAGEGDRGRKTEILAHGVEHPDLGELNGEVGEEDEGGALCLFPSSGDFLLQRVSFCRIELLDGGNIRVGACIG
jgi:hypothetical protein